MKSPMKTKIIIISIGLFLAIILGVSFVKNASQESSVQREENNPSVEIVSVDKVVRAPERYQDFFGVKGIVVQSIGSKNIFLLGCKDACIAMPVKYQGLMPKPRSEVIVYGEIRKQEDGRYVFQGKEVKTK